MSELTGVMQILLYTDTTRYEDMESFYRDFLLEDPYPQIGVEVHYHLGFINKYL